MPTGSFEIRICESCGLRYPLVEGHPFGTRCPVCMGNTRLVLRRRLAAGPESNSHRDAERNLGFSLTDSEKKEERKESWAVLLDNVRSAWNVGSILRSADGFGFAQSYLCGITPTPDNEAVQKTSLGAEDSVPWSYHRDAVRLVKGLKAQGWKMFALEKDPRGVEIRHATSVTDEAKQRVLIVGNEVTGVDPELLDLCDAILEIPMRGEKKSFNVAIAFGIAAYALTHQSVES